jgi:hypothetical protein
MEPFWRLSSECPRNGAGTSYQRKLRKERLKLMSGGKESRDMDLEWENRVLCSDESCIGTIGPDGRCRECGRLHEGTLPGVPGQEQDHETPAISDGHPDAADESQVQTSNEAPVDEGSAQKGQTGPEIDDWERRTLCPDESCIGVIGPDGRCKECGKTI